MQLGGGLAEGAGIQQQELGVSICLPLPSLELWVAWHWREVLDAGRYCSYSYSRGHVALSKRE